MVYNKNKISSQNIETILSQIGTLPKIKAYNNSNISKEEVLFWGKKVFEDTNLSLKKILYLKRKEINDLEKKHKNFDCLSEEIKLKATEFHPFDVPVAFCNNLRTDHGITNRFCFEKYDSSEEVFSEIILSSKLSKVTPSIYSHELTHTQGKSDFTTLDNYLNHEVLPLFIDKLSLICFDKETFETNEIRRLYLLKRAILILGKKGLTSYEKDFATMIVCSTLIGNHLFYQYIYGTKTDRTIILDGIQNVFDNKYRVDDILEKRNISLENSINIKKIKNI